MNPALKNHTIHVYERNHCDWICVVFRFKDNSTLELRAPGQYYKMLKKRIPTEGDKRSIDQWIRKNEP